MNYLKWDESTIDWNDQSAVNASYDKGYLFGRISPGYIYQTRSLRINLTEFSLSSENRRILRKWPLEIELQDLPISKDKYDWRLAKLAKDFYTQKFADTQFSVVKLKQIFTEANQFNALARFSIEGDTLGYSICHRNNEILHYCYPFYDLTDQTNNLGMGMILTAINWAQTEGLEYFYLGGATRPSDIYKLQFKGLQYWENSLWKEDINELKAFLIENHL